MDLSKYKNILWDWNGTLINDKSICIKAMNIIMQKRDIPKLTEEVYLNAFTFPVKDYYQAIGFDFSEEEFEIPAMEFIDNYSKFLPECQLYKDVIPALNNMQNLGKNQYILSAMQEDDLRQSVSQLKINGYFIEVAGIQDHYAKSKISRGEKLLAEQGIQAKESLMIGDTLHDIEVAESLGLDCILIANGHQAKHRLLINGNKVFSNLNSFSKSLNA